MPTLVPRKAFASTEDVLHSEMRSVMTCEEDLRRPGLFYQGTETQENVAEFTFQFFQLFCF